MTTVSVVVPTIPPRSDLLNRALASVDSQTRHPDQVLVQVDLHHEGAAATRDAGLRQVTSEWVAFLDDDDYFYINHIEKLLAHAESTGGDYVYSDFVVPEHPDFRLENFAYDEWRPGLQTTITTLVRAELAMYVGFRMPDPEARLGRQFCGEDYDFTVRCYEAGASIVHLREVTWAWSHHGENTSGMATRW